MRFTMRCYQERGSWRGVWQCLDCGATGQPEKSQEAADQAIGGHRCEYHEHWEPGQPDSRTGADHQHACTCPEDTDDPECTAHYRWCARAETEAPLADAAKAPQAKTEANPEDPAAAILAVIGEPLGLGDEDLPGYGTAPPGTCVQCHRGPLRARGRCPYCLALDDLRPVAERAAGGGGLPLTVLLAVLAIWAFCGLLLAGVIR